MTRDFFFWKVTSRRILFVELRNPLSFFHRHGPLSVHFPTITKQQMPTILNRTAQVLQECASIRIPLFPMIPNLGACHCWTTNVSWEVVFLGLYYYWLFFNLWRLQAIKNALLYFLIYLRSFQTRFFRKLFENSLQRTKEVLFFLFDSFFWSRIISYSVLPRHSVYKTLVDVQNRSLNTIHLFPLY